MAKKKASEVSRARKVRSIERLTHDYFLRIGGELSEPLKIAELWELYWEGRINDREPYWTDGLNEWRPIYELAGFGQLELIVPPSPPSIFQRLFRRLTNAPEPAADVPDLPVRRSGNRCGQCNGPAILYHSCRGKGCGMFCRPCIRAMWSLPSAFEKECPICGGDLFKLK